MVQKMLLMLHTFIIILKILFKGADLETYNKIVFYCRYNFNGVHFKSNSKSDNNIMYDTVSIIIVIKVNVTQSINTVVKIDTLYDTNKVENSFPKKNLVSSMDFLLKVKSIPNTTDVFPKSYVGRHGISDYAEDEPIFLDSTNSNRRVQYFIRSYPIQNRNIQKRPTDFITT